MALIPLEPLLETPKLEGKGYHKMLLKYLNFLAPSWWLSLFLLYIAFSDLPNMFKAYVVCRIAILEILLFPLFLLQSTTIPFTWLGVLVLFPPFFLLYWKKPSKIHSLGLKRHGQMRWSCRLSVLELVRQYKRGKGLEKFLNITVCLGCS